MHKIIFFLILSFFWACKAKDIKPKEANMICYEFFVSGQFKHETYSLCSTVPVEIGYHYETGNWKFWNLKGQLIAEGPYTSQKIEIQGQGGCPYELIRGVMDKDKWNFWDDKGKPIKATEDLINKLEACTAEFTAN